MAKQAVAQLLLSKKENKYVKVLKDIPEGSALNYISVDDDLASLVKNNVITQSESDIRREKIPSFVLGNFTLIGE